MAKKTSTNKKTTVKKATSTLRVREVARSAKAAKVSSAGKSKAKSTPKKGAVVASRGKVSKKGTATPSAKSRLKAVTKTSKLAGAKPSAKNGVAKQLTKPKVAAKSTLAKKPVGKSVGRNRLASIRKAGGAKSGTRKIVQVGAVKPKPKSQAVAQRLSTKASTSKTASKVVGGKSVAAKNDYSEFRAILLDKRRRLFGDVAMMSEEALGSEDSVVDSQAPIHPAEVGSHSFEQEFTLGLLSRDGDKIRNIDLALEKFAEGTYGSCDECGSRIPKGRLEMLPESIYCVKCASKLESFEF